MEYPPLADLRLPAICTVLVFALNLRSGIAVGVARRKYKVPFPETDGPVEFKRSFRAHCNNAEQYPQFLALMWTCAVFSSGQLAGIIGLIWIAARHVYVSAYQKGAFVGYGTVPAYFCLMGYSGIIVVAVVRSSALI
jgi:glutathione S-transferase